MCLSFCMIFLSQSWFLLCLPLFSSVASLFPLLCPQLASRMLLLSPVLFLTAFLRAQRADRMGTLNTVTIMSPAQGRKMKKGKLLSWIIHVSIRDTPTHNFSTKCKCKELWLKKKDKLSFLERVISIFRDKWVCRKSAQVWVRERKKERTKLRLLNPCFVLETLCSEHTDLPAALL